MMTTPTPSQLILMTMLPLKKATKPGADVDNDVDNVNDNHDE